MTLPAGVRSAALVVAVSLWALGARGQTIPLDPGPFPPVRFEENDRALADTPVRTGLFGPIKYIGLGDDPAFYLSLGGEIRERYEHYGNEGFRLLGPKRDDYQLSRILLHADVHLGDQVRVFVQFGRHDAVNKAFVTPVDADGFDVQQAFVDVSTPPGDVRATVRVGRQEILLGSGRFVDVREGPNVRQSHDGVRGFVQLAGGARVDAFLVRPVLDRPGNFDDTADPHQLFSGLYATIPVLPGGVLAIDGYYLGLKTKGSTLASGGMDDRHTVGTRLWGRAGSWDYDTEVLFQFGSAGHADIRAGGVAAKAGYTVGLAWPTRFGVQADYFSGGPQGGRTVSTFNPLFPRGGYFSEPGLQTFENLVDAYPSVTVYPVPALAVQAGLDFTWRASTQDAVYLSPGIPVPGTAHAPGGYIGTNFVLQASWTATPNITIAGSLVHVASGSAIRRAGGKDIDYAALWTSLRF